MIAILSVKANHLAYIEPRWFGSQIFADCQQKVLFTKHDTNGRFLLVTFLEKQKREDDTQRYKSVYKSVLLASGFYIYNFNSRWIKTKSNHFSQREGFTRYSMTIPTQIETVQEERILQVLLLLLALLLSLSIHVFNCKFNK